MHDCRRPIRTRWSSATSRDTAGRRTARPRARARRPPVWLVVATAADGRRPARDGGRPRPASWALPDRRGRDHQPCRPGVHPASPASCCIARRRWLASLPLVLPWLLFPVITQGDQIIDNLSIAWMRIVVHVLLARIFAMPVAVVVFAARCACWHLSARAASARRCAIGAAGRSRCGSRTLFLGALMVVTLVVMIAGASAMLGSRERSSAVDRASAPQRRRRCGC